MSIVLEIALAVLFALSILTAFHMLNDGGIVETTADAAGGQPRRKFVFWRKAGVSGWITSISAGSAMFAIQHFIINRAGVLSHKTIWLAYVMVAVIIAAYVALAFLWHCGGSKFREAMCFAVIANFPVLLLKSFVGVILAPSSLSAEAIERVSGSISALVFVAFMTYVFIDLIRNMKKQGNTSYRSVLTVVVTAVVILFALIILVCLTGCNQSDWKQKSSESSSQSEGSESLQSEEMKKAAQEAQKELTIPELTGDELEKFVSEEYKGISEEFLDYSLPSRDGERTKKSGFNDALTYPFTSEDTEVMYKELREEILRNPVFGVTFARFVVNQKIGDKTIGDINKCLLDMIEENDTNNKDGLAYWLQYRDTEAKVAYVTKNYRKYAAKLCYLIDRFIVQGVEKRRTIENWCLNFTVTPKDRAGVLADYQYERKSLVLAYVTKDGRIIIEIGFNTEDKRPEGLEEKTPPPPESSVPEVTTDESSEPPCSEPEYSKPESSQPSKPESSQPSKPESSEPSRPESSEPSRPEPSKPTPTPEPSKPESSVPYNKDPSKAPKTNTEPNDVSGPGPDTNNGKGATESKKDQPTNSTKYPSYEKYKEDMEEMSKINQEQKTGKDNNEPTTKPKPEKSKSSEVSVDNNGDKGTGNGGINTPTPQTSSAETVDGHKITDDPPGVPWEGPPD